MNDSVTIQGLQDALNLSMREVKDLRNALEVTKQRLLKYENIEGWPHNDYVSLLGDAFALLNSNEGSTYSFEAQKKDLLSKICNLR